MPIVRGIRLATNGMSARASNRQSSVLLFLYIDLPCILEARDLSSFFRSVSGDIAIGRKA